MLSYCGNVKKPVGLSALVSHLGMPFANVSLQTVRNLSDQSGSLHSDWPSHCWNTAWCLNWAPASSKNHWALLSWWFQQAPDRGMNGYLFLVSSPHWKNRFYSNAFKNIWTLSWPSHCGLLIVPSLFQISDPSLLHIMSQWAAEICQGSDLPVCVPEHPLWITEWEGRALCSSLTCVLHLCLSWYLSCHQCYVFIQTVKVFFKQIYKLAL